MIQEHSTANVALQTAARNAQLKMVPRDIVAVAGSMSDRAYLQQQVATHSAALATLEKYAAKGANPILKAYAGGQVDVVQNHLDKARTAYAATPAGPVAGASVAPIPPGGNEGAKNGGQIAPNASASPVASSAASASASSSPNPLPSLGAPIVPGPKASASPKA
ncbi:MAG: hypothetical protein NVS3B28_18000 [Candidatus Velthaea sp.]